MGEICLGVGSELRQGVPGESRQSLPGTGPVGTGFAS
jgi:hypothetical protein